MRPPRKITPGRESPWMAFMTVPIFCYIRLWADAEGPAACKAAGPFCVYPKNPRISFTRSRASWRPKRYWARMRRVSFSIRAMPRSRLGRSTRAFPSASSWGTSWFFRHPMVAPPAGAAGPGCRYTPGTGGRWPGQSGGTPGSAAGPWRRRRASSGIPPGG